METQTIQFAFLTGQSVTVKLFADDGTDTVVATPTATEATNRIGVYSFTQTDRAAGTYLLTVSATGINAAYTVQLTLTTATFWAHERTHANVTQFGGANGTFSGGRPEVNLSDGAITAAKIAASALSGKGDWATSEQVGEAGSGLTLIPWNPAWDAEVQSECTDALNAYDGPTKAEQDAAFTEIKGTGWSSATDTLAKLKVDTAVARSAGVVQIGIISNAGTAVESYTYGGQTVTFAGLDTSGNRDGVTVT